ncbi:PAS domain-containing sensor histidine kinase [Bacillus sp. AFS076308]|uniref:ATP-binding protein n=1 Tax=unclassified Bacillus (in: firmicutes) TaxID=185979 RepID=UPI000BF5C31D|nr:MULTISPECIES: ATP-binding protein [unclassified Bacillus (in: firmicutes)]PFO08659.1 PAS domain-containing sensor histidine kinase [Bacillus sp. AFS076308]PGV49916.1 PAS domain-containing sensor histidine kinase [Bacillus sp. AFS037270]
MVMHGTDRMSVLLKVYRDTNMDKDFSILSKNRDAFILIDLEGKIEYSSHACEPLLGYSRDTLHQIALNKLFVLDFLNQEQTFFKGREQEKLDNFDAQVQVIDGSILDVNVTSIPIFFEQDYLGAYLVIKDITSIKQKRLTMEREKEYHTLINNLSRLSEKQATAGQLAAGIAHEIRNPITAIKGFLQLLMGENAGNRIYFEIINSEIDRIEEILKELMVLAKPTKQKYERVNLQSLLEQVITLMASQALLNNIQIDTQLDFTYTWITGDKNQLKQVFINFIKNAIEAMPEGGMVQINGSPLVGGQVRISITDQGCGIPEDILNQIGQPFFTTKENGTGLGLLVSRQIIKEHKGDLYIESSRNGTTLHVEFPLSSEQ